MIKLPPYTHAQQGRSKLLLKPLSKLSALLKQWLQVSKSVCACAMSTGVASRDTESWCRADSLHSSYAHASLHKYKGR